MPFATYAFHKLTSSSWKNYWCSIVSVLVCSTRNISLHEIAVLILCAVPAVLSEIAVLILCSVPALLVWDRRPYLVCSTLRAVWDRRSHLVCNTRRAVWDRRPHLVCSTRRARLRSPSSPCVQYPPCQPEIAVLILCAVRTVPVWDRRPRQSFYRTGLFFRGFIVYNLMHNKYLFPVNTFSSKCFWKVSLQFYISISVLNIDLYRFKHYSSFRNMQ